MKCYLVEAYSQDLKFKNDDYVVALTPLAAYELDKAGIKYSILEDYYDEAEFLKQESVYYEDQLSWFDDFDELLFSIFPEARDKNQRLATADYFHLKDMVDSLILRCKEIKSLLHILRIDKVIFVSRDLVEYSIPSGSQPLLFRGGQSLFSRVTPLFCKKYGIQFERNLAEGSSTYNSTDHQCEGVVSRLKARLKSDALLGELWHNYKTVHLRQLLPVRSTTHAWNIYFLKTNRYVRNIMRDAIRREHRVYYNLGEKIVEQNFVRRRVAAHIPKDDNRLSPINYSQQFGPESDIIKWINDYCGIDVSQLVLPRLKWYINSFCVRLIRLNEFFVKFYDSEGIDLVLTSNMSGVEECAAITACMLSCKTRSGCLQHGDEGFAMKMHDLSEIAPYNYYFTTHAESEAYTKKRVGLSNLGTKVFQYPNRITTLPHKNFANKFQRMFKQHRTVVYVPTMYQWDNTFWNESRMSDTWYFRWHKALLDFMSKREDFNFIWKGIPASNEIEDPIPMVLKGSKVRNVRYAVEPFMKWLHRADLVLLDYPSTALYEAAMSGVPVFSLFYEPSNAVRDSFLQLFGKNVTGFTTFDDGIRKVGACLDSDPSEFTVRIPRCEKSIFDTLKGEFNALKSEKYN